MAIFTTKFNPICEDRSILFFDPIIQTNPGPMSEKHKIIVAVTGASGAIYAKVLFDKLIQLKDQIDTVGVVFSGNARDVWEYELGNKDFDKLPFKIYEPNDFLRPLPVVRRDLKRCSFVLVAWEQWQGSQQVSVMISSPVPPM